MMNDNIKLKLAGISEILGIHDVALLGLVDEFEQRQLVVTCDQSMRKLIQMNIMDKPKVQTRFPMVMGEILRANDCNHLQVLIRDVCDGEYLTEIVDEEHDKHFPIRCSDGVLFAVACDIPLYASFALMQAQSIPYKTGENRIGLPLTVLSEKMLKISLKKAIETENYEMASNLRDELKRRSHDNQA